MMGEFLIVRFNRETILTLMLLDKHGNEQDSGSYKFGNICCKTQSNTITAEYRLRALNFRID